MKNTNGADSSSRSGPRLTAWLWGLGVSLALLGVSYAESSYVIFVGGKASTKKAVVLGGEIYIPLSVAKQAGLKAVLNGTTLTLGTSSGSAPGPGSGSAPSPVAGGANQRASLEGCMNEYLFNGIWRIKVTKLEQILKDGDASAPGWGLTLELRNGSKATLDAGMAGMNGTAKQIAFADATTIDADPYGLDRFQGSLTPGGVATQQFRFYYPYGTPASDIKTPVKFLLEVDPKGIVGNLKALGAAFSSANPSFRVHLDCTK